MVPFTQGSALGYVLLPLRGVLFMSFDTLTSKQELLQYCFVGALLALASGKAERRQVHPLESTPTSVPIRAIRGRPFSVEGSVCSVHSVGMSSSLVGATETAAPLVVYSCQPWKNILLRVIRARSSHRNSQ